MTKPGNPTNKIPLLCLFLFGLVVVVFWSSLQGKFLFYDESAYIVKNPYVNTGLSWHNLIWGLFSLDYANWHPVTWWSHMLDCQLYGLNPWGHHLTNILIHSANTVLVFVVFRKMTHALWPSLIVALLFGLHPLRVASAGYISERRDVLSLFFWMLTLWAYVGYAQQPKARRYYLLALLFFILGLMSKSMVVTLPFVLLLLDFWPLHRSNVPRLILEKVPFFILTFIVCCLAYVAQHKAGMMREMADLSLSDRLGNAVISYVRYIGKLFWPADLCAYYPHPGHWPTGEVLLALVFLVAVSLCVWLLRQRMPYLLTGWCWYLGTLVPVIGLVQLLSQSIADRYTYIPELGLLLMLAWALKAVIDRWPRSFNLLSVLLALAVAACVVRTEAEIPYYHDDVALWSRTVAVTTDNAHAHYSLGLVLEDTDKDRSLTEFQEAVRLNPGFSGAQNDLACLLATKGRYAEALTHFQVVLELDPTNTSTMYNTGEAFLEVGQLDESIAQFQKLLQLQPDNTNGQAFLADCVQFKYSVVAANLKLREILQIHPDDPEILNDLAWFLATTPDAGIRNGPEAVTLAERAVELTHHKTTVCLGTLAAAYAQAGRFDDAINTAEQACASAEKLGETSLLQSNQHLLSLYRTHTPYIEIPSSDPASQGPSAVSN